MGPSEADLREGRMDTVDPGERLMGAGGEAEGSGLRFTAL